MSYSSHQSPDGLQPLRFPELFLSLPMPADIEGTDYLKVIASVIKADAGDFDVRGGSRRRG